jgi:hypothetical protein
MRLLVRLVRTGCDVACDGVDLVEGEPVLAFGADALEEHAAELKVAVDDMTALPAPVGLGEMGRELIVADGDERLNAVRKKLIHDVHVKLDSLFVGGVLIARGEDAAPGDGEAVHAKTHLGHEGDVFLPVMVEVDRLMARVVLVVVDAGLGALGDGFAEEEARVHGPAASICHLEGELTRRIHAAVGLEVACEQAAAAFVKAALALEVGGRAAPQERIGKLHRRHEHILSQARAGRLVHFKTCQFIS